VTIWGTAVSETAASIMAIILMTETADLSSVLVHAYWTAMRQTDTASTPQKESQIMYLMAVKRLK
jgi:hypothetical protein